MSNYSLYLNWHYVHKPMPDLYVIANLPSHFYQFIINSDKLPLYKHSYDSLLYSSFVQSGNQYFDLFSNDLKKCLLFLQVFRITVMLIIQTSLSYTPIVQSLLFLLVIHSIFQNYMFPLLITSPTPFYCWVLRCHWSPNSYFKFGSKINI